MSPGKPSDLLLYSSTITKQVRKDLTVALNLEGPSISEVQGLSPVPALAASELQPAAQLATTACYRLNATLYFEPSSELVLNAATGTSGQISDAILDQAGLRVS